MATKESISNEFSREEGASISFSPILSERESTFIQAIHSPTHFPALTLYTALCRFTINCGNCILIILMYNGCIQVKQIIRNSKVTNLTL